MAHQLPELPYSKDALAPHISAETLDYHHGKHHNAYVTKLNAAIEGTEHAETSLEDSPKRLVVGLLIMLLSTTTIAYWNCLAPNAGGDATGIRELINASGIFDKFKAEFTNAGATNFGSGWFGSKKCAGELEIVNTDDAGCPLTEGQTPLLTMDVWEHAYYVDYRNARPSYMEAFWNLVNWDFVNSNL